MAFVDKKNKMKILCLHGFRTNGDILKKQISRWDPTIFSDFQMDFPNGIFPAGGISAVEGIFPGPYFEWFQFNDDFTENPNLDKCVDYLCHYIETNGPFDGLLGFSQGARLSALLLGYQKQGIVLKNHPKFKLCVCIAGSKFVTPDICNVAYKDPIDVRSVHFIGDNDQRFKKPGEDAASDFVDPLILRHPLGHTVPRLNDEAVEKLKSWVKEITTVAFGDLEGNKLDYEKRGFEVDKEEAEVVEAAAQA